MGHTKRLPGYLLSAVLLLPLTATADVVCALGPNASAYKASSDQGPSADALEMARRVNAALSSTCSPKCPQIAIFRNTTAANAMLIVNTDEAKLVYAPQFFSAIYDKYGDGAIIAIIAHLYGHALDETYPAKWMSSGWSPELRADAWAGCALARIDPGPGDLADALTAVSKYPSAAHPGWPLRLPALRTGYVHCGGEGSKFDAASNRSKRN
jgi:hypothetical protein